MAFALGPPAPSPGDGAAGACPRCCWRCLAGVGTCPAGMVAGNRPMMAGICCFSPSSSMAGMAPSTDSRDETWSETTFILSADGWRTRARPRLPLAHSRKLSGRVAQLSQTLANSQTHHGLTRFAPGRCPTRGTRRRCRPWAGRDSQGRARRSSGFCGTPLAAGGIPVKSNLPS